MFTPMTELDLFDNFLHTSPGAQHHRPISTLQSTVGPLEFYNPPTSIKSNEDCWSSSLTQFHRLITSDTSGSQLTLPHGGSYVLEINIASLTRRVTGISSSDAARGTGFDIFPAQREDLIPPENETNSNEFMKIWTSRPVHGVQPVGLTPSMSFSCPPWASSKDDVLVGVSLTEAITAKPSQPFTYDSLSQSYHAAPNSPPFSNSSIPSVNFQHTLTLLPLPEVKRWLIRVPCTTSGGYSFICEVDGCLRPPVKDKTKAQEHIYQHLGIKVAVCSCGKVYSSRATAERHANTQVKRFACGVCSKRFGRKDYRGLHEKKCNFRGKS
ncbi:hypothetical protein K439DRAFT_1663617 [Ramaria rubella]|nr:hypothetical protein K439DRAFT_1663617 [Ramaria rubella]